MNFLSKTRNYLKALTGLVSIVRDPEKTQSVFVVVDALSGTEAAQRMIQKAQKDPATAQLFAEQYLARTPDLDELLRLPQDSLGYLFADRMRKSGFDLEFYPKMAVKNDNTYMHMRIRQTHDIWHTITGFATTPQGEIGLQAFYLAQLSSPLALALIGGAMLRGLGGVASAPMDLPGLMDSVTRGWQMGVAARPLLGQKWEEGWAKPLAQWQKELNVTPVN